jgi:hypothetical protein
MAFLSFCLPQITVNTCMQTVNSIQKSSKMVILHATEKENVICGTLVPKINVENGIKLGFLLE